MNPAIGIVSILFTAGLAFYAGTQSAQGEARAALERTRECHQLLTEAYAEQAQAALAAEGERYCARCEMVEVRPEDASAE